MTVSFELPHDVEQHLRNTLGDPGQAAKEAALVGLYRQGHLSHRDLAHALGRTRLDIEALLKHHGVVEDLPTEAEYDAALTRLRTSRET